MLSRHCSESCYSFDGQNKAAISAHTVDVKKVVERESYSRYIYPPLKRGFRPTVRIIALVLTAIRKFKKGRLLSRKKNGEPVKTKLAQLNFPPVKFKGFPLLLGNNVDARVVELSENDDNKINLTQIFG